MNTPVKFDTMNIEWTTDNPEKPGKYIVETRTTMGNTNRFESYWNGKSWRFTNQVFVKYLKEYDREGK